VGGLGVPAPPRPWEAVREDGGGEVIFWGGWVGGIGCPVLFAWEEKMFGGIEEQGNNSFAEKGLTTMRGEHRACNEAISVFSRSYDSSASKQGENLKRQARLILEGPPLRVKKR